MENGLLAYAKCTNYTIHNCCVGTLYSLPSTVWAFSQPF